MEKVRIRKIIEDIIITQFLNSEMDIVHEEDVTFKELGLDSLDQIELENDGGTKIQYCYY